MGYRVYPGKEGAAAFAALVAKNGLAVQQQGDCFLFPATENLAVFLADYIYGDYCKYHLAKALLEQVEEISWSEAITVAAEGLYLLTDAPRYQSYHQRIVMLLARYLSTNDVLHIPGFLAFRLPELKKALAGAAISLGEEFSWRREYDDFVQLLRQERKPPAGVIHVFCREGSGFRLEDEAHHLVDPREYCSPLPADRFGSSEEDLLVSSLIALSPAQIYFHQRERLKESTSHLLADVFGGQIMP